MMGTRAFSRKSFCGTVGEVLRQNGYMTAWIGKNHNTPTLGNKRHGPFDRWANGLGFEYFYGFNAGRHEPLEPYPVPENRNLVPASSDPNFTISHDRYRGQRRFPGYAPSQEHRARQTVLSLCSHRCDPRPHHTPKEWIEKFRRKFDGGWDKYREETLERQKKLGVVPKDTQLTVRSKGLPAWDSLNGDQKRLYARMMEVFAAYGAHCDHELGRVVQAAENA